MLSKLLIIGKKIKVGYGKTVLAGWICRAIQAGVQLLFIPIIISKIGESNYSIYILLAGLAAWTVTFELGVGYTLQNKISSLRAVGGNFDYILALVPILFLLLYLFSILVIALCAYFFGDIYLANAEFLSVTEKKVIFFICFATFATTSTAGISYRVLFSLDKGWLTHILPTLASILGLVLVIYVNLGETNDLLIKTFLLFNAPVTIVALLTILYFLATKISLFDYEKTKRVITSIGKQSLSFFVSMCLMVFALNVELIIASQYLQSSDVVAFGILTKWFGLALFMHSALMQAVWPIMTEMKARLEFKEIKSLIYSQISKGFLLIVVVTLVCLTFPNLLESAMGLRDGLLSKPLLIISFGAYYLSRVFFDSYASALLSLGESKALNKSYTILCMLSLTLQILFVQKFGLPGMVIGAFISMAFVLILFLKKDLFRLLNHHAITAN